jgi:hypothetical protein
MRLCSIFPLEWSIAARIELAVLRLLDPLMRQ